MNVAVLPAVLPASSHHPPSSCLSHGDLKDTTQMNVAEVLPVSFHHPHYLVFLVRI